MSVRSRAAWAAAQRVPWRVVRLAAAVVVAAGSFTAFRFVHYSWCILPDYDTAVLWRFLALPMVFAVAFVWLTTDLLGAVRTVPEVRATLGRAPSILYALVFYAAIAAVVFLGDPVPADASADGDADMEITASVLWSIGLLQETGNFSAVSCGY